MRLLAIDYGEKRVGIASTDESGEFALPRTVLLNDEKLIEEVINQIKHNQAEKVILGESKNLDNTPNKISKDIEIFKKKLEERGVKVVYHPEVFTSLEAERIQGKTNSLDASAAAIILKSYIDKNK